ncbi:universal stress protein [Shewanella amazonensis]|uniref:UspA domain-containing protein n=1 Tax=Shewanella amazonensis (strain ATCC BAA-1098 / SB2B) TaxID=326297 RepID=A1S3H4_SHEAM|nr:universal stress protein [Shewanella amazonensis]ABL98930.1 hypothetical protein Sama_0722 [Shewanella amazonensis SB2B]
MGHFSRVLVATDDGLHAKPALRKAVHLANQSHADLTMLRVQLPKQAGLSQWLQQLLTAPNISHQRQKHPSYPDKDIRLVLKHCHAPTLANAVLDELSQRDYDLLILEHHEYSALRCEFGHTEDWQLLQQVPIPVLFVSNEPWENDGKLLTALEVDDEGERHRQFNRQLLDVSDELARLLRMELHLLTCYQAHDMNVSFENRDLNHHTWVAEQWRRLRQTAEPLSLEDKRLHLAAGLPDDMVPEAARQWHSNLVVMGASEHTSMLSTLKGRASEQLLNQLKCDVLALKPQQSQLH